MKKIYIPFLLSFFIQYAQTGTDIDGDGILDQDDNCINVWNPNLGISSTNGIDFSSLTQRDHDNNGIGDLCDDNYIVINIQENAPIGSVLEFVQFLPSDFSELSQGENFPLYAIIAS